MARASEFGDDSGADPAGRAGDEHTHENLQGGREPRRGCHAELMSVTAISVHLMSACVINYDQGMGRWEPDAPGRLAKAAMELYLERGFEQTSVAEIARRAGLTERTFF